jgi:hypothetical protein
MPGTTRDVVSVQTAVDGWPVLLADTAGLRSTDDELESAGVNLATATIADADLVVVIDDRTAAIRTKLPPLSFLGCREFSTYEIREISSAKSAVSMLQAATVVLARLLTPLLLAPSPARALRSWWRRSVERWCQQFRSPGRRSLSRQNS